VSSPPTQDDAIARCAQVVWPDRPDRRSGFERSLRTALASPEGRQALTNAIPGVGAVIEAAEAWRDAWGEERDGWHEFNVMFGAVDVLRRLRHPEAEGTQ